MERKMLKSCLTLTSSYTNNSLFSFNHSVRFVVFFTLGSSQYLPYFCNEKVYLTNCTLLSVQINLSFMTVTYIFKEEKCRLK